MELGVKVTVTGVIVAYAFTNEETGEEVGLVHLRVPGDVVGVRVDPELARKMKEGETWTVTGTGVVSKTKGRLSISPAESMKRVAVPNASAGPKIDFGDEAALAGAASAAARK